MSTFESLDQAWRSLEIIVREVTSGGKQAVRSTGRLARDTVSSPGVQKAVIGTTLLAIAGILLYIPAALGYLYFYYKFLPELETTAPVHLQYGVGPNPFGIAPLTGLANRQAYDITVSLTLPRSPPNLDRGNFMIALHLLTTPPGQPITSLKKQRQPPQLPYLTPATAPSSSSSSSSSGSSSLTHPPPTQLDLPTYLTTHAILHTSTRPALIPYLDPLAATAARVLLLPLNLLLFLSPTHAHRGATSTVRLTVPMAEDLVLVSQYHADATIAKARLPESLLLEVQAGQDIQVYDVRVTLVARLKGLRGFMYRWRATAFVLFTGGFWVVEMGVLVGVVVGVMVVLSGKAGWGVGVGEGDELDSDWEEDGGQRGGKGWKKGGEEEAGGTSSLSPSGFDEGVVKKEEEQGEGEGMGEGGMAKVPVFEAEESDEADDEAEEGGGVKDVGTGTSFSGHRSKEGVRRRSGAGHGVRQSQ